MLPKGTKRLGREQDIYCATLGPDYSHEQDLNRCMMEEYSKRQAAQAEHTMRRKAAIRAGREFEL